MVSVAGAAAFNASGASNRYLGSMTNAALNRPIVGIASTPTGNGYWLAAADGGVFTFGDAKYYGSMGMHRLSASIVGIAATPTGKGYRLVGSDGGVFTFGDAKFLGSMGKRRLSSPIIGIASTPSGNGYWLAAANGGVFTFGDAKLLGSMAGHDLAAPIVGIAASRSGNGYWLAGRNGSVHAFGDAPYKGSARGQSQSVPVTGITRQNGGDGYWLVGNDGTTRSFGGAHAYSTDFPVPASMDGNGVVTIAASPKGGYWVASERGMVGVSTVQLAARPSLKTSGMIAFQLVVRMNAERVARHMAPFSWDRLLAGRATAWAKTLLAKNEFQHQDLGSIATAADGRFEEVGENLFSGTGSAADTGSAHLALMHSPDHRANMLLPQGQLVGIAALCSHGKLMVVEDFAIKMGAPLPPAGQAIPPTLPIVATNDGGAHC
jgi:Cysteine-rich secretory protein family